MDRNRISMSLTVIIFSLLCFVLTGVQACIKSKELVDEKYYEIEVDVHGIRNGPSLGRLRLLNKVTLLSRILAFQLYQALNELQPCWQYER